MSRVSFLSAVLLLSLGCAKPAPREHLATVDTSPFERVTDYQKHADHLEWSWEPEKANLLYCVIHELPDCQREIICPQGGGWDSLRVRILKDGKEVYTLEGHEGTVFTRRGDVLYIAEFYPTASGCSVVAYDFKAWKQLWKSELQGIGPVRHSRYTNQVTIATTGGDAIVVTGKEAFGRYIEYVDANTGKTVGHKVFRQE